MSMQARRLQRSRKLPISQPPTTSSITYITDAQIAQLSTTSAEALLAKAAADAVKNGTASNDVKNVNTRNGPYALMTAIWYKRTNDSSYLAPLINYILGSPKPPAVVQGLNEWRAAFGLFTAVTLLRRWGIWQHDNAPLPNHGSITWSNFLLSYGGVRYDLRKVDTGVNGTWNILGSVAGTSTIQGTNTKTPNNWGGVARAGELAYLLLIQDMGVNVDADLAKLQRVFQQWLGDTTTGEPNYYASSNYDPTWNNWVTPTNTNKSILAGLGKYDPANPGLDGAVINDLDRGGTSYAATAAQWGATSSGITYPLENAEYVWAQAACYLNGGLAVRSWGDHGDAMKRMSDRFARISPDGTSQFQAAEGMYSVYKGLRDGAARISGLAAGAYGNGPASTSGEGSMPRSGVFMDWLIESDWAT